MTRISIAMTTYNGAAYLQEQLNSLLAQAVAPFELQVGDDGSTDATQAIVERFSASAPFPVTFVRNERRLGFGENFIQTARRCSGEWIAFCDQDDVWHPGKLKWAEERIESGPSDLMLLAHNATVVDQSLHGGRRLYDYPRRETVTSRLNLPPEWYCTGFTQVFRADLVRSVPSSKRVSFPWHRHRDAHDVWIALLANCTGSILRSDRELASYRRHGSTVTDQGDRRGRLPLERTGAGYQERAVYLREVAATLRHCVPETRADLASLLENAADLIEHHAELLQLRSRAYSEAKLADRVGNILRLVAAGAYVGRSPWRFGTARLLKDCVSTIGVI